MNVGIYIPPTFRMGPCIVVLAMTATAATGADLEGMLEKLDSPQFQNRQEASQALLANDRLTVDAIARLYERARTHEQRYRLMDVARHHLLRRHEERITAQEESAALIGFIPAPVSAPQLPQLGLPAIRVNRTLPGFPGHAHLRSSDLIIEVNGQTFPRHSDAETLLQHFVIGQIQQHAGGQRIVLTVIRDGRRLQVELRLASAKASELLFDSETLQLKEPYRSEWKQLYARLRASEPLTPSFRPDHAHPAPGDRS